MVMRALGRVAPVIALAVAIGAGPLAGQQADAAKAFRDSVTARTQAIAVGRHVFRGVGTCTACHGVKLEGGPIAPTLRAHKWRNGDGSLGMILRVLHTGVPQTAMVAHPGNINEDQIQAVADYVWAVSRGAVAP
jgi:mono/diheme cytochrome c family protein